MRVLIIRPGALGDTLMLAPALAQMKADEDVVLVARRPGVDILRPFVKEGRDYEKGGWHRLFEETPSPIRNGLCDNSAIDLAVAFLSDRSDKVRDNLRVLVPGASIHLFPPFPQEEDLHAASYLAKSLAAAGCSVNPAKAIEETLRRPVLGEEPLSPSDLKRRVVLHPGSGGAAKNHPLEFWDGLLGEIKRIFAEKIPLTVLLGPAEEACLPSYREKLTGNAVEIIFSPDIDLLLRLLKNALLYLGHDSGITHLAAMLGTPTIALFRKSNPGMWKPLGPRVRLIEGESSPDLMQEVCRRTREMVS